MILTCPSCGATASACAWENDIAARETLHALLGLPAPVAKVTLGYLSLFRPDQRALTWRKAKKVVDTLTALIAPGWVQVQGKPARPCPPHLWAMAMEQMVERAATLQRPLKNHNYLRQVVWQLADHVDAHQEHQTRQAEANGNAQAHRDAKPKPPPAEDIHWLEERYLKAHGQPMPTWPLPPAVQEALSKLRLKTMPPVGEK